MDPISFSENRQLLPEIDQKVVPSRRKLNGLVVVLTILGPVAAFMAYSYIWSFEPHWSYFKLCLILTILSAVLLCVLFFSLLYRRQRNPRDQFYHPVSWTRFVFFTYVIALVAGSIYGEINYKKSMEAYYNINTLNTYENVDINTATGHMIMDAGVVHWTEDAYVNMSAHGLMKNEDTFCVAPIQGENMTSGVLDFWVAGTNCCSENSFNCGHTRGGNGRWSVRRLQDSDDELAFFKLAVKITVDKLSLATENPLFFEWADKPSELINSKYEDGIYRWLLGSGIFVGWSVVSTLIMTLVVSKRSPLM